MTAVDIVEQLNEIDISTLCNAIELLGVRRRDEGFTSAATRCLFPEMGVMAGYAVTAHVETVTSTGPPDRVLFLDSYEAVAEAPRPSVVVLQETGAFGDPAAHCVRELEEVRRIGFRYFARGSVASHAHFRIVRVGEPIHIDGLAIRPGGPAARGRQWSRARTARATARSGHGLDMAIDRRHRVLRHYGGQLRLCAMSSDHEASEGGIRPTDRSA